MAGVADLTVTALMIREEMMGHVRLAAGEDEYPGEHVVLKIRRSARNLGMEAQGGLVRRLWYGTIKCVPAHVADTIRLRAAELVEAHIQSLQRKQDAAMALRERVLNQQQRIAAALAGLSKQGEGDSLNHGDLEGAGS